MLFQHHGLLIVMGVDEVRLPSCSLPLMPSTSNSKSHLVPFVENLLNDAGYERITPPALFFAMREMEQPIYAEQCVVGRDIYGKNRRVDFLIYHPRKWPQCLAVQCKWQASRGTVDEKYPFEVLSIQQGDYPTIILLDGEGYTSGARQWLIGQAGKNQLKHVFSKEELEGFAIRGEL